MKSKDEIIKILEGNGFVYINDYFRERGSRKVIVQDLHGYKYDIYLSDIMRGQKGRFVDKRNPFVLENISLWLKLNNSQFELPPDSKYENGWTKLKLYCKKCKEYPLMTWDSLLQGGGCGICSGQQVGDSHNLLVEEPIISLEWHPTKNGKLSPKDFTRSSSKKVWWICQNGHSYYSSICNRTNFNIRSGCKKCSDERQESRIATELKNYIKTEYNSKEEYPIFVNPETGYYLPYDIYIYGGINPEINGVYIEVHSWQHYKLDNWHKQLAGKKGITPEEEFENQKHRDRLKRRFARKNGTYIEIDLRKIKNTEEAIECIKERIKERPNAKL